MNLKHLPQAAVRKNSGKADKRRIRQAKQTSREAEKQKHEPAESHKQAEAAGTRRTGKEEQSIDNLKIKQHPE